MSGRLSDWHLSKGEILLEREARLDGQVLGAHEVAGAPVVEGAVVDAVDAQLPQLFEVAIGGSRSCPLHHPLAHVRRGQRVVIEFGCPDQRLARRREAVR